MQKSVHYFSGLTYFYVLYSLVLRALWIDHLCTSHYISVACNILSKYR